MRILYLFQCVNAFFSFAVSLTVGVCLVKQMRKIASKRKIIRMDHLTVNGWINRDCYFIWWNTILIIEMSIVNSPPHIIIIIRVIIIVVVRILLLLFFWNKNKTILYVYSKLKILHREFAQSKFKTKKFRLYRESTSEKNK